MAGDDLALEPPPPHDPLRWWFHACTGSSRVTASLSLELRWFGWGQPPAAVSAVAAGGRAEARIDWYAPLGRDDVSIKLRGRNRLSIKQRRGRIAVAEGLPAAERWTRRTGRTVLRRVDRRPPWIAVSKRRSRLLFDLGHGDPVAATGRRSAITRGGAVEVVELEVPDRPALWSAACETWGPADREALGRLLDWPGVDWSAVDLAAWVSGSYPSALNRLDLELG